MVQTYILQKVTESLSDKVLDAEIIIEKVHFKPFNTIVLKNTVIRDKYPVQVDTTSMEKVSCMKFRHIGTKPIDTLFNAEYIIASFTLKSLLKKDGMEISRAYISNGSFNLVIEDNDYGNNLSRMFRIKKKEKKEIKEEKDIFLIRSVDLEGFRYTMKNYEELSSPCPKGGINWNDLDVTDINLKARDLRMRGKVMSGTAAGLSFKEKSGYICHNISGSAEVGNGKTIVRNLRLQDPWSEIRLERYCMSYDNENAFKDYVNEVRMDTRINYGHVDFRTLGYFAPQLEGNRLVLDIKGEMSGPVEDMIFKNLEFSMSEKTFHGTINGELSGLTSGADMTADLKLDRFTFTTEDLGKFIRCWSPSMSLDLRQYAEGTRFVADVYAKGKLKSLETEAHISSAIGNIEADINISGIGSTGRGIGIKGILKTEDLRLDKAVKNIPIRECSLYTDLNVSLGKDVSATIDTLSISRLFFNGYDYKAITAEGSYSKNGFEGQVACHEPNLQFTIRGMKASSGDGSSQGRVYADVSHADLNALNIDKRGKSLVSLKADADFMSHDAYNTSGNIDIADIILENGDGQYDIGGISISAHISEMLHRISLKSSFAEVDFSGTGPLTGFLDDMALLSVKKELPALFKETGKEWSGSSYNFLFKTSDTRDLLSFILPGMYIAENTVLNIAIDSTGIMDGALKSQRIAFKEQYIKDLECMFDNKEGNVSGELNSESISVATLMIKNNNLKLFASGNHLGIGFTYDNQSTNINKGEVVAVGDISKDEHGQTEYRFALLPSSVYIDSHEWNIYPSEMMIGNNAVDIKRIEFRSGEQSITASGNYSNAGSDTLDVNLERFDLSVLNPLLGPGIDIGGAATGYVKLLSPFKEKGMYMNLVCNDMMLAGEKIGDINISTGWDEEYRKFDIDAVNILDGKNTFSLNGNYYPSIRLVGMSATLDKFNVHVAQPFLQDIFSEMDGSISGTISVAGPFDRLSIKGEGTRLENVGLKVAYTNVKYMADGTFGIDEYGVYFNDISISDRYGNKGDIRGKIGYNRFKDMYFDTQINVDRIEAIDINEKDADAIYGHLFATGTVALTGPMASILLSADASTAGDGQLHIPLSSSVNAGIHNLLKFKEPASVTETDPYDEIINRIKQKKAQANNFGLRLRVNARPEVEALIEIDKESGNVLSARGNGLIDLNLIPNKDIFDIKGDYTIRSGNYRFVALGLAARDFSINEGSSIKFNGDIMESALNINATYRTKASLSALIADTTSVSNRRIVECGIKLTDKLKNPRIGFSINIPDIDPIVKSRVESALSTEDKVQKQFLSLIISNNFLPDEQSGVVNNSSMLLSNVTELMSNQLNNIFQKLDIPLDLGLTYQPNETGNDIFDVAVSTQLFNNRVVVNGNIGNRQYNRNNSQSDLVGDLDIEVKLNRPGTFRLTLFSHSADQYTNYLDDSQRNGVGLMYQQEFDHFTQFFKNMFIGRKKREEKERIEAIERQNEERVQFKITPEHDKKKRKKAKNE